MSKPYGRKNTIIGNSQRNLDPEFPEGISKKYTTALKKFKSTSNALVMQLKKSKPKRTP